MRRVFGSIRARITMLAVVLVALVLGVGGVVLVRLHERQLVDNLDQSLEQRADQIEQAIGRAGGDPFVNSNAEDRIAQLLDAEGMVIESTPNVGGGAAVSVDPEAGVQTFRTVSDLPIEDDVYRVLVRQVQIDGEGRVLVVGENIDDLDDNVRTLTVLLATSIPVVVLTLGGLVWWLVGRTLRPVEEIRRRVASIGPAQLDERVPEPGTDDEIDRLAITMNAMLDRLDEAAQRQLRFVADASHELRSPLTRVRSTLEVDLAGGRTDLAETCRDALAGTIEMQQLVDDLLFLARRADSAEPVSLAPVDLDVLVDAEVHELRTDADVVIDQSASSAASLWGSSSQLRRLVRNLLDNAVRYAESEVAVALAHDEHDVRLTVDDDGPGIPVGDRKRVFDRFTRLDDARATNTGGSGLGLAIAAQIVGDHGGRIVVDDSPLGGARVEVVLPTAEP